jgi:hypothetical protein
MTRPRLVNKTPESLTLDYKEPRALAPDKCDEICKDVSSFANSEGGTIIYGMHENKRVQPPVPTRLEGITDPKITIEWIDQVLGSRISPRLDPMDVIITPVSLSAGGNAWVIEVRQATARPPHQAPDRKYHRRFQTRSEPMYDYEIRDVMRRSESPLLYVELSLGDPHITMPPSQGSEYCQAINLDVSVANANQEAASHATISIDVDRRVLCSIAFGSGRPADIMVRWKHHGEHTVHVNDNTYNVERFVRNYGYPDEIPLFFDNLQRLVGPLAIRLPREAALPTEQSIWYYAGWSAKAVKMAEQSGAVWLRVDNRVLRIAPLDSRPTH